MIICGDCAETFKPNQECPNCKANPNAKYIYCCICGERAYKVIIMLSKAKVCLDCYRANNLEYFDQIKIKLKINCK